MRDERFYALNWIVEVVEISTTLLQRTSENKTVLIEIVAALDRDGNAFKFHVPYVKNPGEDDDTYRLGSWRRDPISIEKYREYARAGEVKKVKQVFANPKKQKKPRKRFVYPPGVIEQPVCKCGAKMVARENTRTRYKRLFWGCPRYPDCKNSKPMPVSVQDKVKYWARSY